MVLRMPSRAELVQVLEDLCTGKKKRSEVAGWASSIIDDDSVRVDDMLAWDVLKRIGAVDLPAPDREFLYEEIDLASWIFDLNIK